MAAVVLLLLLGVSALGAPNEVQARSLGCTVALPEGWTGEETATGLTAHDGAGNSLVIAREPLIHTTDAFGAAWEEKLGKTASIEARVERTKLGGREAWHSAWSAGGKQIEVWRIYVPECEMLYELSFTAAAGFDLKSIVDPALKSFKCTPPKEELVLQKQVASVSSRAQVRLPVGYENVIDPGADGGGFREFAKYIPGYDPPHEAGRIKLLGLPVGRFELPSHDFVDTGDPEATLDVFWTEVQKDFEPVKKKPRPKNATFSGLKGCATDIPVVGKDGLPRRWMAFCGRAKQDVVLVTILVDERDARLHKDYLKQVCSTLVVAK